MEFSIILIFLSFELIFIIFRKLILGDYRWMTYEDADQLADNVGRGLRVLGLTPNKPICIFADTRAEWLVTAQACFR